MTNLFDLRLIGAMLYLSCKLSHSACLSVYVRERGNIKSPLFILKDDTFNLGPAKEIKKHSCY